MAEKTVADACTALEKKFGLSHSVEGNYVLDWYTRAYRAVHNKIRLSPAARTVAITSGTSDYTLGVTIESYEDVTVVGSSVKPTRVTVDEILDRRRFVTSGVAPGDIFVFAIEGDLLMVYPSPTSNFTITFYGTILDLTTSNFTGTEKLSTDIGLVSQPLQDAVEAYASWKIAEYDDKITSESVREYLNLYAKSLVDARKSERRRAGRGLLPARTGYPGRRGTPKRNDTYPDSIRR